jgi:hypothetical protein
MAVKTRRRVAARSAAIRLLWFWFVLPVSSIKKADMSLPFLSNVKQYRKNFMILICSKPKKF